MALHSTLSFLLGCRVSVSVGDNSQDGLQTFFFGRIFFSWSQLLLLWPPPAHCCFCSCFNPYSLTEPDTLPAGWPQICSATPGQAQAPTLLSLLEEASKPLCSHPEPGCGLLGKGKNLWQFFSVFLIWRAMRLTDVSKCLFPECCDKMKPALTGTCSLFPSWSLICHCWRLEDLNGSETDTSLGLLPNARSMYVSRPLSLPEKFTEG